jgi:hypothetical protein
LTTDLITALASLFWQFCFVCAFFGHRFFSHSFLGQLAESEKNTTLQNVPKKVSSKSTTKKVAPPRKKTKTAAKQTKKDMTEKKGLETKKQQQVSPQMPRKGTYIK